ncbi:M48 family metallopeptidase [Pelagicoccus sp. NFK12]|uniref:M48 family metallopeptidase n=1 Tax=Pelagicoccus enzymogenes TaxID=2773457 RepID=A0A927F7B3_9BACT|nr:SprT family zinc-dependent metalloprotease [Pelagicoccus enzymogenes]MBD5779290.1 M48 family metallopeptidase [Pelagicoccus enzymogenes]MDQ8198358.1 SprT family zinc-dependent metalloprotease [Pelagicoccus enzymogenes]
MSLFAAAKFPLEATIPLKRKDVVFRNHPLAKSYLAKVDKEGNIVLTVPRTGTERDALAFANKNREWLEDQRLLALKLLQEATLKPGLRVGDLIWFRGKQVALRLEKDFGRPVLCFAKERIYIADESMDLARPLKAHLHELAKQEFPRVVFRYAEKLREVIKKRVKKVVVRDQKTRWGSCSTSGTISLNWRLILASEATRDYVIVHELMHMRRFDHSPRFWALVEAACPSYRRHEAWLKAHQEELSW